MSEVVNNDKEDKEEKKASGSYISDLIISILIPIAGLWYGPKYLIKGEYVKGGVIILWLIFVLFYLIPRYT